MRATRMKAWSLLRKLRCAVLHLCRQASPATSALALVLLLGQTWPALAADVLRVHETYGLFMEKWGVREAVNQLKEMGYPKAEWSKSYHNQQRHVNELIGLPQTREEMDRHAVIVLNNIPAHALTPAMSTMLKQYVTDGGCIVMM